MGIDYVAMGYDPDDTYDYICEKCDADLTGAASSSDKKIVQADAVVMMVEQAFDDFVDYVPGAVPRPGWDVVVVSHRLICPDCGHDNGDIYEGNEYRTTGATVEGIASEAELLRFESLAPAQPPPTTDEGEEVGER